MTRAKIAIYLALIFIAGAIAGGAVVMSSPETFNLRYRSRPHGSPEEFANHLWNQIKDRLQLTDEQAQKIEPIFRDGFAQVTTIQDNTLQQVEATIHKNHEEMEKFLSEPQKLELQKMDKERRTFLINRGKPPAPRQSPAPKPTN